jgi:hypothetical protein
MKRTSVGVSFYLAIEHQKLTIHPSGIFESRLCYSTLTLITGNLQKEKKRMELLFSKQNL